VLEAQSQDFRQQFRIGRPFIQTQENPCQKRCNNIKPSSKEKLLKVAETLFATESFKEVSVGDIAPCAKEHSALVGCYFGGKQVLFKSEELVK
jgi:hypothetical protein